MSRHHSRNHAFFKSALLALGVSVMLIAGCGKNSTPTSPTGFDGGAKPRAALSLQNPADLALVMRVQNLYTHDLLKLKGVVGTGTGTTADGHAAIVLLTQRPITSYFAKIDGIPVVQRVVGTVVPYALQMGTSTGNDRECAAGTLACVVSKAGQKYFLSNNHVFARENAAANGERLDAPGRYDGHPRCAQTPACGTLADYQKISFTSNNTIDAAIALPSAGLSFTSAEAGGYTPVSTVTAPSVGLAVKKSGRTSRLTHATIQAINVTIQVQYSSGIATFVNQIMTPANFIRAGDSGSLMVTENGNNPVGLCFAGGSGGSFANPIGPVLSRFSATVGP